MSQHVLFRRPLPAFLSLLTTLAIGLGLAVAVGAPANAGGSDSPVPYTVTSTTLTLPAPQVFSANQEINYHVTKLDGTGRVDFGVGNNIPHNGVWPRDIYIGKSVYTWTDHPNFPASYKTSGYCITWVQVGHFNEHFGEGGQAPVCWRPDVVVPRDADASVQVSSPACGVAGVPAFTLRNASWTASPPTAPGGPYTITATAASGHLFSDGTATKSVTYSVGSAIDAAGTACHQPVPVKPAFSGITECATRGSIDLAGANAAADHIRYSLESGTGTEGVNVVVATALDGYTLLPGADARWVIDLGEYEECVAPAASSTLSDCRADSDGRSYRELVVTFDNTASTTSVWFEVTDDGVGRAVDAGDTATRTIEVPTTGSPERLVRGDGETLLTIPAIDAFEGCVVVNWLDGDPIATDESCDVDGVADGSIWVDRMTGLEYRILDLADPDAPAVVATLTGAGEGMVELPAGHYRVTVEPLPGYLLNPVTAGPWEYTIHAPQQDCEQLETKTLWPANATATDQQCATDGIRSGTITVGLVDGESFFGEVDYFLDGSTTPMASPTVNVDPGEHRVTAVAKDAADGIEGAAAWTLTVAADSADCDLPTLAFTGANAGPWAALAGLLAIVGAILALVANARRRVRSA